MVVRVFFLSFSLPSVFCLFGCLFAGPASKGKYRTVTNEQVKENWARRAKKSRRWAGGEKRRGGLKMQKVEGTGGRPGARASLPFLSLTPK